MRSKVERMGRILIEGLRATGTHGVLAEEQHRAQPFEVDIELELDVDPACRSDDLSDTVDYGALSETVARIVSQENFQLIERLAARIGEACRADRRVTSARVTVRKLRPPVPVMLDAVAVTIDA